MCRKSGEKKKMHSHAFYRMYTLIDCLPVKCTYIVQRIIFTYMHLCMYARRDCTGGGVSPPPKCFRRMQSYENFLQSWAQSMFSWATRFGAVPGSIPESNLTYN